MTKKKEAKLAQPVAPDKWERQRQAEKATPPHPTTQLPMRWLFCSLL
jgi:hypothetical protein